MTILSNPLGANQQVSDFRTMRTVDGELLYSGAEQYVTVRANANIVKGQAVQYIAPTQIVPISGTQMATNADRRLFVGIATATTIAGRTVQLCIHGHCEVLVAAGDTPAFGDVVLPPSVTAGVCVPTATDPDATAVIGNHLGTFLGPKDGINLAPAFIRPV
jgi:hypothetical protein